MPPKMRVGVKAALIAGVFGIISTLIIIFASSKTNKESTIQNVDKQSVDTGNINNYNAGRDINIQSNSYTIKSEIKSHSSPNLFKLSIKYDNLISLIESSSPFKYSNNSNTVVEIGYTGDIVPTNSSKTLFYFSGGNVFIENKTTGCRENLNILLDGTDPSGNNQNDITRMIQEDLKSKIFKNLTLISTGIIKCLR